MGWDTNVFGKILSGAAITLTAAAALLSYAWDAEAQAQASQTEDAFIKFLADADYNNANFYLQNGLVDPAQLDTAQIFYDIVHARYWRSLEGPSQPVAVLHDYLTKLRAFDINQEMRCDNRSGRNEGSCTFVNDLAAAKPALVLVFFADLGLDLNRTFPKRPSATFDVINRLGAEFTLSDIQLLSQKGMIFGDEVFEPAALAAHYEYGNSLSLHPNVARHRTLTMPDNYLSLTQLNFMDALIVALGNQYQQPNSVQASARDTLLCQYVTFVASQMRPSFDYLTFVLANRSTFRAAQIGERKRSGNATFEPFPPTCVALIAGMAQNHARLNDVIALFGARGDVETARWLLSLKAPATASSGGGGATANQ